MHVPIHHMDGEVVFWICPQSERGVVDAGNVLDILYLYVDAGHLPFAFSSSAPINASRTA